ncbi:hypothetical protein EYF80_032229 [Liparis tanakae]|uniref:Secreted protein n=1 Tax=Liparis tanakae TaxID=230148 RepID=A0A4Z2GXR6_9TELE|nr:hypothetical protein EYF80_032229 [Liparis tanakae]
MIKFHSFPFRLWATLYFLTNARLSALAPPPASPPLAPWVITPRTVFGTPSGCAGAGNQPERLATRRALPGFHTMSLLEEAEICVSGSRPDSRPCSSEHGASGGEGAEGGDDFNPDGGVAHDPACTLLHISPPGSR